MAVRFLEDLSVDGDVGIGTTSPESKLHVDAGDVTITGFNTSRFIRFTEPANSYQGGFINYDGSANIFYFGTHNANDQLTANDVRAFSIARGSTETVFNGVVKFSGGYVLDSSHSLRIDSASSQPILFSHADSEVMRISSGNVGIGTTSPDHLLQVESSGNAEIQAQRVAGAGVLIQSQSAVGVVGTNTNHRLDLKTNNATRATISTSGNFGIGTSSPAKTLDVNGDTNITGYLDLTTSSPTGSPLLRFYQSTTRRGFIQMADTNDNLRVTSEYGSVSLEAAATSGVDSDTSYIRINPGGTVEIGAVDGDATITTDGNMTFRTDADNDETSQKFSFQSNSPATEVASISDTGALSIATIELGNTDTTLARASAGKVTIEGAPIQTTQMSMSHHNFYFNTTSTTVDYFVPFNSLTESSNPTITNYYGRMVAPYDGRIVKAVINTTAAIGTACSAQFWVATSAGTFAPSPAETVSNINLNTANTAATATFSGTSTAEFSEGDVVGLSIQKSGTASTAYIQVTIVWEYTV